MTNIALELSYLSRSYSKQVAQLSQRDCAAACTVTLSECKAIELGGKKTENKGYYAVQGHSRSSKSVPIESPCATSY